MYTCGVSQNVSSVINDSFCYKAIENLASDWLSAELSLIYVICHSKRLCERPPGGMRTGDVRKGGGLGVQPPPPPWYFYVCKPPLKKT